MDYLYPSVEYDEALLRNLFGPRDIGIMPHVQCRLQLSADIPVTDCTSLLKPHTNSSHTYERNPDGSHSLTCQYYPMAQTAQSIFNKGIKPWDSPAKHEITYQMLVDKDNTQILIGSIVTLQFTKERISETVQDMLHLPEKPVFEDSKLRISLSQFEQLRALYRGHRLENSGAATAPASQVDGSVQRQGTVTSNVRVVDFAQTKIGRG